MDLQLYFRVLWRFRLVVIIGVLLACVLSFLSFASVRMVDGKPKVSYRQSETWKASVLVLLTQKGFSYGYSTLPTVPVEPTDGGAVTSVPQFADEGRLTQLASAYSMFVQSDEFNRMLRKRTRVVGIVSASPALDPVKFRTPLPYLTISGYATSPEDAVRLANTGSTVFADYLTQKQNANAIPRSDRVETRVMARAHGATISTPRKKTTPIVVFLTVLLAAIGLSFILENLRPRIHPVELADDDQEQVAVRRSA